MAHLPQASATASPPNPLASPTKRWLHRCLSIAPSIDSALTGQRVTHSQQLRSWKYRQRSLTGGDVKRSSASMTRLPKRPAQPESVITMRCRPKLPSPAMTPMLLCDHRQVRLSGS